MKRFFILILIIYSQSTVFSQEIFSDGFEDGELKPEWTARPSLEGIDGIAAIFSTGELSGVAHSGSAGFAFGKSRDGGLTTNALDLKLDLTSYANAELELSFWFTDFFDETHFEDGVFISDDDGQNFHRIFAFEPSRWTNNLYGRFVPLDLDSLIRREGLAATSEFVIRFQQRGSGNFNTSSDEDGIFIDDIEVTVAESVVPVTTLPYTNDFETGLGSEWKINNPFLVGGTATEAQISQSWSVGRFNGVGRATGTALGLGKFTDSNGANVSAIDLHLDLAAHSSSELEFSFWFSGFSDETHFEDGIFISDDGGQNFHRIFAFEPSRWTSNLYGRFVPLDLDSLIRREGLAATSQFVIRFQQRGTGNFNTSGDEDGIYIDDLQLRVVEPVIPVTTLPYTNDFETALGSEWKINNPFLVGGTAMEAQISQSWSIGRFNGEGRGTGAALGLGKFTDSNGANVSAIDLHLDLAAHSSSELEFSFWFSDFSDETHFEDGIFISDDGGQNFHRIFAFEPSRWTSNLYGRFVPLDLDSLIRREGLAATSQFVIRFQQRGTGNFSTAGDEDGIFIDDLQLRVVEPVIPVTTLPYANDFETALGSEWKINNPFLVGGTATEAQISQSWSIGRFNGEGRGTGAALGLGKFTDSNGTNVSAIDLHLDLAAHSSSELEFSFWFSDFSDETHFEDGIFISDDGGQNFHRIFAFEPSRWTSNLYGRFVPLDLDSLIRREGLAATPQFVIRFQQRGTGNFSTAGDEDGIYIDDLQLRVVESAVYAALPFNDTFETQTLGSSWLEVNPNFAGNTAAVENITPSGLVTLFNTSGVSSSAALAIGKRNDSNGTNTSAADLHLDLRNAENVELEFQIRDFFNENNQESALYVSTDSTRSYTKIFDFDFNNLTDNQFENILIDISQLAQDNGLSLNGGVIFRFQQTGTGDFNTSGAEDGIILDNVVVRGRTSPSGITIVNSSFEENLSIGSVISSLSTTDLDGDTEHTYSLVAGEGDTNNNAFSINGNNLLTGIDFDFEAQSNYTLRVRTTDPNGLTYEENFTLSVTDVNEAPLALSISNNTADENSATGLVIGSFTTTDQDQSDTHSYSLVTGNGDDDNTLLEIQNNQLVTKVSLDFETKSSLSVLIRTTDAGGLSLDQSFTITVNDINEEPLSISMSPATISENEPVATVVGTLSAEDVDAGDSHTYALVSGSGDTDNAFFVVNQDKLETAAGLDFETKSEFIIRVRATDTGGLNFEGNLSISLTNVEEPNITLSGDLTFNPTALQLSSQLTFSIANDNNDGVLEVTDITVPDGFSLSGTSFSIGEESSQEVTVTFSPLESRNYSGELIVTSSAGEARLAISGQGAIITSLENGLIDPESILLYPNPAKDRAVLKLPSTITGEVKVSVFSVNGLQKEFDLFINDGEVIVDTKALSDGIYLLIIQADNSQIVKKLIIQN